MAVISTLKKTKAEEALNAKKKQERVEIEERMMTLSDVVQSLAQGTKPLGWLVSLSIGGVKVPADKAREILQNAGINNPGDWLTNIHPTHAFKSAIATFEVAIERHHEGRVFEVEKWEAENIRREYFLTYRRIDNDKGTEIEAHKAARLTLDNDRILSEILDTPVKDQVESYVKALKHEFEERKTHYYRQHFRYMLHKMVSMLGSIKWSDNSMYFVPRSRTKGLEDIEKIITQLKPYKTTTHRSAMLCVPIPDVEEVMGKAEGGYREHIAQKLDENVQEQLDELLQSLTDTLSRDNARDSTKRNRVVECYEQLEVITEVVEDYKEMLQSELRQVYTKIKAARAQIQRLVTQEGA